MLVGIFMKKNKVSSLGKLVYLRLGNSRVRGFVAVSAPVLELALNLVLELAFEFQRVGVGVPDILRFGFLDLLRGG